MVNVLMSGLVAALLGASIPAQAAACRATSGPGTAALVELFTSEGCDSCPPAERWLAQLPADAVAAGRIVPIAWHVSYWDYLGWKDPYAQPRFTERQKDYPRWNAARNIYTPQVVLAGRDHRGWRLRPVFDDQTRIVQAVPARAMITIQWDRAQGLAQVATTVSNRESSAQAALNVVLLQSGLSSAVTAGENRGETLKHAYVARRWFDSVAVDDAGRAQANLSIDERAFGADPRLSLAAFVQDRRSGAILQANILNACAR